MDRRTRFYVSPAGSDRGPGTKSRPFFSLTRARNAVRETISGGMQRDVFVFLDSGTWFLAKPLRFDERDSGRNGHKVIYKTAPGKKPVVYGGIPVNKWEKLRGDVYRAKVNPEKPFFRLYENGESAVMARYPKEGRGYGGRLRVIDNTTVRIPDRWIDYDFSGARVFGFVGRDWFSETRKVKRVNRRKRTLTLEEGGVDWADLNRRVYLEGVPELLSEPGEWCLSRQRGYLYYRPRRLPIEEQLIVTPRAKRILDVRGSSPGEPVTGIRFEGITFRASDFTEKWEAPGAGGHHNAMPRYARHGAVHIENAERIELKFCRILGAGVAGVYMNHGAKKCSVYGCWIEDSGFGGVYMNGWEPGRGPFRSAAASYVNRNHLVSNNVIYDCGKLVGHGCGVQFYQSGDNEISHNVIAKMPRYGISYKGECYGKLPKKLYGRKVTFRNQFDFLHTRNNVIRYNEIHNVCRDSSDYGAIESWGSGRGNVWENNAVHDLDLAVNRNEWAFQLYPDDASHHLAIRRNIIYQCRGGNRTAVILMKSVNNVFENNIVADCSIGMTIMYGRYWEPAGNIAVRRNIFFRPASLLYHERHETDPNEVFSKSVRETARMPLLKEADRNVIYPAHSRIEKYVREGREANSIQADPKFDRKNPVHAAVYTDYALKPDSPAFKTGFQRINTRRIGLKADFPFDRRLAGRKDAFRTVQAEDHERT
ncbi:MAG: right-handed parallel beta-helix repeat-containing protein, partial [Kiritimatiellia bacterium]